MCTCVSTLISAAKAIFVRALTPLSVCKGHLKTLRLFTLLTLLCACRGVDSMNRDVIPEWEKQDDRYSFWGREGGWRNICGPRQHPMWDPQQKQFYTMKEGQASNYVKHWCTCMPSGNIEIETKQGVDTMGCEGMYEAGSNMKSVSVSPSGDARRMGRGADVYETTAPGYKYQRVMDRHDDLRWQFSQVSFFNFTESEQNVPFLYIIGVERRSGAQKNLDVISARCRELTMSLTCENFQQVG
jgi:hypothetical protein